MAPATKKRREKTTTMVTTRRVVTRSFHKKQQLLLMMEKKKSASKRCCSSFRKLEEEDRENIPTTTKTTTTTNNKRCDEVGCTTPKSDKYKIPEIVTCPPAPKKPRVSPSNNCLVQTRRPISFFAHPDIDKFFMFATRDHIKLNTVVAWIDPDGPMSKLSGPVAANTNDEDGNTCQQWSHTIKIPLSRPIEDAVLRVNIVQVNASLMDCAHLPIRDLVSVDGMGGATTIGLQLHHPSSADTVPTVKVKVFVRDSYAPRPDIGGVSYALPYPEPILLEPTYPEPILLEPTFPEPTLFEPSYPKPSYPGRGFWGSRGSGRS